jgi:hypothetical protein
MSEFGASTCVERKSKRQPKKKTRAQDMSAGGFEPPTLPKIPYNQDIILVGSEFACSTRKDGSARFYILCMQRLALRLHRDAK